MVVIFDLGEIKSVAENFLQHIGDKKVVAMHGAMGAGKTTFVHAVCDVLGVSDAVSSPTFSIINEYTAADGQKIYHLDLYRIKDEEEAMQAGVEDVLYSGNLAFVEWPDNAKGIMPPDAVQLKITLAENGKRKIELVL